MYRVDNQGQDGKYTLGGRETQGTVRIREENENPVERLGSTKKSLVVALSLDG